MLFAYLDKTVYEKYILVMPQAQMIDAIRWYSLIEGGIYGFLFAQLVRAISTQRTARRLDLSPLGVFCTLMLVAIYENWIGSTPVSIGFYSVLLVVSLIYEVIKRTVYPQEIYASRPLWGLIGVICGFLMIFSNTIAYLIIAFMLAGIIIVGFIARDAIGRKYGSSLEFLRNSEVMPWIGLELCLNIWFWLPVVSTHVATIFQH